MLRPIHPLRLDGTTRTIRRPLPVNRHRSTPVRLPRTLATITTLHPPAPAITSITYRPATTSADQAITLTQKPAAITTTHLQTGDPAPLTPPTWPCPATI